MSSAPKAGFIVFEASRSTLRAKVFAEGSERCMKGPGVNVVQFFVILHVSYYLRNSDEKEQSSFP